VHPITNEPVAINASLDEGFARIVAALGWQALC